MGEVYNPLTCITGCLKGTLQGGVGGMLKFLLEKVCFKREPFFGTFQLFLLKYQNVIYCGFQSDANS